MRHAFANFWGKTFGDSTLIDMFGVRWGRGELRREFGNRGGGSKLARDLMASLPQTEEFDSHGSPTFPVRSKIFTRSIITANQCNWASGYT
jgi:hypothetical protein